MLGIPFSGPLAVTRHLLDYPSSNDQYKFDHFALRIPDPEPSPPKRPLRPGNACPKLLAPIPIRLAPRAWMSSHETEGLADVVVESEQTPASLDVQPPTTPTSGTRSRRGTIVHPFAPATPSRLSRSPITEDTLDQFKPPSIRDSPYQPVYLSPRRKTPELIALALQKDRDHIRYMGPKPLKPRQEIPEENNKSKWQPVLKVSEEQVAAVKRDNERLAAEVRELIHKFPDISNKPDKEPKTPSPSSKPRSRSFSFGAMADKYNRPTCRPIDGLRTPSPPVRKSSSKRRLPFTPSPTSTPSPVSAAERTPERPSHATSRTPEQRSDGSPTLPTLRPSARNILHEDTEHFEHSPGSPQTPRASIINSRIYGTAGRSSRIVSPGPGESDVRMTPSPRERAGMGLSLAISSPMERSPGPTTPKANSRGPLMMKFETPKPRKRTTTKQEPMWSNDAPYVPAVQPVASDWSPIPYRPKHRESSQTSGDSGTIMVYPREDEDDSEDEDDIPNQDHERTPRPKMKLDMKGLEAGAWITGALPLAAYDRGAGIYAVPYTEIDASSELEERPRIEKVDRPFEMPLTPRLANHTLPILDLPSPKSKSVVTQGKSDADVPAFLTPFSDRGNLPYHRTAKYVLAQTRKREANIIRAPPSEIRVRKKRVSKEKTNLCVLTLQRNLGKAVYAATLAELPEFKTPPPLDNSSDDDDGWWGGKVSPPENHKRLPKYADDVFDMDDIDGEGEDEESVDQARWTAQSGGSGIGLGLTFEKTPLIRTSSITIPSQSRGTVLDFSTSEPTVRQSSQSSLRSGLGLAESPLAAPSLDTMGTSQPRSGLHTNAEDEPLSPSSWLSKGKDLSRTPSPASPKLLTPEFDDDVELPVLAKEKYKQRPVRGFTPTPGASLRRQPSSDEEEDDRPLRPRLSRKDKGKGKAKAVDVKIEPEVEPYIPSVAEQNAELELDYADFTAMAANFGYDSAEDAMMQYVLEQSRLETRGSPTEDLGGSPGASGSRSKRLPWISEEDGHESVSYPDSDSMGHESTPKKRSSALVWTEPLTPESFSMSGAYDTPDSSPSMDDKWETRVNEETPASTDCDSPFNQMMRHLITAAIDNEMANLIDALHIDDHSRNPLHDTHDLDRDPRTIMEVTRPRNLPFKNSRWIDDPYSDIDSDTEPHAVPDNDPHNGPDNEPDNDTDDELHDDSDDVCDDSDSDYDTHDYLDDHSNVESDTASDETEDLRSAHARQSSDGTHVQRSHDDKQDHHKQSFLHDNASRIGSGKLCPNGNDKSQTSNEFDDFEMITPLPIFSFLVTPASPPREDLQPHQSRNNRTLYPIVEADENLLGVPGRRRQRSVTWSKAGKSPRKRPTRSSSLPMGSPPPPQIEDEQRAKPLASRMMVNWSALKERVQVTCSEPRESVTIRGTRPGTNSGRLHRKRRDERMMI